MAAARLHMRRQVLVVLAAAVGSIWADPRGPHEKDLLHPSGDGTQTTEYIQKLFELSRTALLEVKSINDKYMTNIHKTLCEKQEKLNQGSVCQRDPAGFDKDLDCPWLQGHFRRDLLSSARCADLLEEESFFNATWILEDAFKKLQVDTLLGLQQESVAVEKEFSLHSEKVRKSRNMDTSNQKESNEYEDREKQAWLGVIHERSKEYAEHMTQSVSELQKHRDRSLTKVFMDKQRVQAEMNVDLAELQKHAEALDCWAAVDGTVYDFTPWLQSHPGNPKTVENECGKDITNDWFHFHAALKLPEHRRIGKYVGDPNSVVAQASLVEAPRQHPKESLTAPAALASASMTEIGQQQHSDADESPTSPRSQESVPLMRRAEASGDK